MKRNKLFGIFNIVDILLILIVIIVGIVGGRMLLGGRGAAEGGADKKTYSYVVMGRRLSRKRQISPLWAAMPMKAPPRPIWVR